MNQTALDHNTATKVDGIVEPYDVVDKKAFSYLKKHAIDEKEMYYFFGYTHKSSHICKLLKEVGIEVILYETDEERYEKAKSDGFTNDYTDG